MCGIKYQFFQLGLADSNSCIAFADIGLLIPGIKYLEKDCIGEGIK